MANEFKVKDWMQGYESNFALLECDSVEQAEQIVADHQEKYDGEYSCASNGFQILVQYCDEGIVGLTEAQIALLKQSLDVAMQTVGEISDLKLQLFGE